MTMIALNEAQNLLAELIARAERGEEITISSHGRPIARILPALEGDEHSARQAFEELKIARQHLTLGGLDWKELRDAGRR